MDNGWTMGGQGKMGGQWGDMGGRVDRGGHGWTGGHGKTMGGHGRRDGWTMGEEMGGLYGLLCSNIPPTLHQRVSNRTPIVPLSYPNRTPIVPHSVSSEPISSSILLRLLRRSEVFSIRVNASGIPTPCTIPRLSFNNGFFFSLLRINSCPGSEV